MKKLLAIVISMAMVVAMVPMSVFATNEPVANCENGSSCTTHEAAIGTTHYGTLQEAINAGDGKTIELIRDVILRDTLTISSGTITLDLNGKTITATKKSDEKKVCNIYVSGSADLTIKGNGYISGPNDDDCAALDTKALINVEGTNAKLTVLNGTITAGGKNRDGMYGIYVLDGGNVTLGNSEGGPTIETWFAAVGENNTTSPANITIENGIYTQRANPVSGSNVSASSHLYAAVYASASGTINIKGGTFTGYYGVSSNYKNVNQNINISGGTFNPNYSRVLDVNEFTL